MAPDNAPRPESKLYTVKQATDGQWWVVLVETSAFESYDDPKDAANLALMLNRRLEEDPS